MLVLTTRVVLAVAPVVAAIRVAVVGAVIAVVVISNPLKNVHVRNHVPMNHAKHMVDVMLFPAGRKLDLRSLTCGSFSFDVPEYLFFSLLPPLCWIVLLNSHPA